MRRPANPSPATVPTVQVIERMFAIIDVLAGREEAMPLKEIREKTGLHPSPTNRILNDLATGRFVDRPEPGTYRLGMRLLELGNVVKSRLSVRDAALNPMRDLHRQIQQPVNLSVRQGDESVYIERAYSERSVMQVVRAIGARAPLHLTSVGKLFLAADEPQRVRVYASRTGLSGHTRNSITQLAALERELTKARQSGVARDNEELELGVRCMAAGGHDDQGKLVAGLSISAPADRLDEAWLPKLEATAQAISSALGHSLRGTVPGADSSDERRGGVQRRTAATPSGARLGAGTRGDHGCGRIGFDPTPHTLGIPEPAETPGRIQEHHHQLPAGHTGLHDQATPGFSDIAGLLQTDVPQGVGHQAVGGVVLQAPGTHFHGVAGRG